MVPYEHCFAIVLFQVVVILLPSLLHLKIRLMVSHRYYFSHHYQFPNMFLCNLICCLHTTPIYNPTALDLYYLASQISDTESFYIHFLCKQTSNNLIQASVQGTLCKISIITHTITSQTKPIINNNFTSATLSS